MFEPYSRNKISEEIKNSSLSYIHGDAIRLEDGTWPVLKVISVEDAVNIIKGDNHA